MKGKKDLDYKVYGIIKLLSSSDGGTPTEREMLQRMKVMTDIRHRCAAIHPFEGTNPPLPHTHTKTHPPALLTVGVKHSGFSFDSSSTCISNMKN